MVDLVILVPIFASLLALLMPANANGFAFSPPKDTSAKPSSALTDSSLDVALLDFSYPVVLEPEVLRYLDRFRGSSKPTMVGWLAKMGRYQRLIETELIQAGCPSELIAVAMIESGFSPDAYSRAGAVGVWQFMLPTALALGARVDDWVDERRHVQASTRLAARYLKEQFDRFGSWHLALAAYNAGGGTVARAIAKGGTNDYWHLVRAGLLPREASHYVPKAIAAMIVIKKPSVIGLETVVMTRPPNTALVSVSGGIDLISMAKQIGVGSMKILQLNPHLRRGVTPPDGEDFALVVPKRLQTQIEAWVRKQDDKGGQVFETSFIRFGERLKDIAWSRRLSLRRLRIWNDLGRDDKLASGTKILIPANHPRRSLRDKRLVARSMPKFSIQDRSLQWFPVLYGQRLAPIAERFSVTTNELRLWNGLSDDDWVPRGLALRVWTLEKEPPPHTVTVLRSDIQVVSKTDQLLSEATYRPGSIKVFRHRIKRGDTLWRISKRYKSPVAAIRGENLESQRIHLTVGKQLNVPVYITKKVRGGFSKRSAKPIGDGGRYVVRRGDTLWRIASRFRTNVKSLRRLNKLSRRSVLRVGQKLRVPGR